VKSVSTKQACTMRSIVIVCLSALYAATLPASATATAAATAMFPALRKKRLAAVQQQQHTEKAEVVDPDTEEPAEKDSEDAGPVRPPVDAGPEGYPVLPTVSTMLSDASGTLKAVSAQASSLEARVVQAQMASEAKMAKQKAAFDEKLKQQEETNRQVINANGNISAEIKNLKESNSALKKHSKEIEHSNKDMRAELLTLESHLGLAKDFTSKSLTSTDDSKNSLLQVLHSGSRGGSRFGHHHALVETASSSKRKHDDDQDDEDNADDADDSSDDKDEDDDEDSATSFLSLSMSRASTDGTASFEASMSELDSAVPQVPAVSIDSTSNAAPGDLLEVLSKDVANLAAKTKAAQNNLKQLFIRDFRAGAKRHAALLKTQKSFMATRSSLLSVQDQLKKAEAHLESTHKELEEKLHGLGQFLQKLAHFAMAPQHEVPHLLEVLPKTVTEKLI